MPLYEFKCLKCDDLFEVLVMNNDETVEMKCPHCDSENFEKILSSTNYAMGTGPAPKQGASTQSRSCPNGSCSTYTIPGPD